MPVDQLLIAPAGAVMTTAITAAIVSTSVASVNNSVKPRHLLRQE